jgi:transposase
MMGQLPPRQNALFYEFCLEKQIPDTHLLRQVDQFLDFTQIRQHLQSYYSHTGCPSIDPELMIRMLLVGYCYGIRSERRLCEEVQFNLAYRWFCRLGLEDKVPDHSTFSKNRHGRFREADLLRLVFDTVVQRCNEHGLIKGEGFAIDASYVRADTSRQRAEDGPVNWTPAKQQTRAVKEYLQALDEDPSFKRPQKKVSLTDPMSQWSGAKGPAEFYYSTNYLVDVEHGVIMDVEASPSTHGFEVGTTQTMIERVEQKHQITPERLMGDLAYGTSKNLGYLVEEKQIEPHIPVWDKFGEKPGRLSRSSFIWEAEADRYRCPNGKYLLSRHRAFKNRPAKTITRENKINYRASMHDCENCKFKPQCCPTSPSRKIARDIHENARDVARALYKTPAYNRSYNERNKVEMAFAHMKYHHNLRRLRLRGINGANDEFLLVATAQNLKKLAIHCSQPPPDHRISASA